ncbi:hypothetical protein CDEST_15340 [Colletotrichum destructivum]|uniref:Uncharacterized protein n=1 Tax=Colletotrichum destructivum TaxID=34406 RepID=A0AAX4J489_9PEZI|nr:hypothetical protein CDEST_15340 [Colletotrichum destructivum]
MTTNAVFVPMGVQAFVVTTNFSQSKYRVAPLIQPDYSILRAGGLLNHDVMEQLQLSNHRLMAKDNTRFVDVTNGQGITATEKASVDHPVAKLKAGYTHEVVENGDNQPEYSDVKFRSIPTPYLVFRIAYSRNSSTPSSQIFVLESDRIRNINEADLADVDVENLTSAFLNPKLSIE